MRLKFTQTIRALMVAAMVLVGAVGASTQPATVTLTASNAGTCTGTTTACAFFGAQKQAGLGLQITGTFVGTVQFEQTIDGTTWVALSMTPSNSPTTVTSATAPGLWTGAVTNNKIRVRCSAYTSGSIVVYMISTEAFKGGSSGSSAPSDATFITQTPDATLTNEQALSTLATGLLSSTTGTGVVSSVTTSAGVAGLLSDETGSGALVFGTSPTIATPTIASFTNATHNHTNAAGGGTLAEAALALTDVTTANATSSAHGFMPKLSGNAFDFTLGDGSYSQTVAAGTITTSKPWNFTQTWNAGAVVFTGTRFTVTPTAYANTSDFFSIYEGSKCRFAIGGTSVACIDGLIVRSNGEIHTGSSTAGFTLDNGSVTIQNTQYFQTVGRGYWHSSTDRDFLVGSNGSAGVEYAIKVGAAPTMSGCGTGATISGTNSIGRVTIGTTPGAACTVIFSQAFTTNAPHCDANDETSGAAIANVVPTTSQVVLTGTFTNADKVSYHCIGWQ